MPLQALDSLLKGNSSPQLQSGGTKVLSVKEFWGISIRNHGRPWACEREGPVAKKMLWKMGVYSRLSERLIGDGRDSAVGA